MPGSESLTEAVNTIAVAGHGQPVFLPIAVARVDEEARALVSGSEARYRFPSKSYGNIEGIAWLSRDTLVAVSDRKKARQPARCAEKDQSIHLFRIPAG